MLSIAYENIYSRFLGGIQAYDLLKLSDENAELKMNEWLMSVKSNPKVRKLFSYLSFDTDHKLISCELKNSLDDESDIDLVVGIFALGMIWKWCSEKYNSVLNTSQFFGGKEEKWFAQGNHMAELKNMSDSAKTAFYSAISNHGYYNNAYLKEGT